MLASVIIIIICLIHSAFPVPERICKKLEVALQEHSYLDPCDPSVTRILRQKEQRVWVPWSSVALLHCRLIAQEGGVTRSTWALFALVLHLALIILAGVVFETVSEKREKRLYFLRNTFS